MSVLDRVSRAMSEHRATRVSVPLAQQGAVTPVPGPRGLMAMPPTRVSAAVQYSSPDALPGGSEMASFMAQALQSVNGLKVL